jgi:hypothetical protein
MCTYMQAECVKQSCAQLIGVWGLQTLSVSYGKVLGAFTWMEPRAVAAASSPDCRRLASDCTSSCQPADRRSHSRHRRARSVILTPQLVSLSPVTMYAYFLISCAKFRHLLILSTFFLKWATQCDYHVNHTICYTLFVFLLYASISVVIIWSVRPLRKFKAVTAFSAKFMSLLRAY